MAECNVHFLLNIVLHCYVRFFFLSFRHLNSETGGYLVCLLREHNFLTYGELDIWRACHVRKIRKANSFEVCS